MNSNDIYNIACGYFYGEDGYPLNYRKAYEYSKQAADMGNSKAMSLLGHMYNTGTYVEKDFFTAFNYFQKAYELDNEDTYISYSLGEMYFEGKGTSADPYKAYRILLPCVENCKNSNDDMYPHICWLIAKIYLKCYENYKDAFPYVREAATHGSQPAWYVLGHLYEHGYGTERDDSKAMYWYKKSAESNNIEGVFAVGDMYFKHSMYAESRPWIEKAASSGHKTAQQRLRQIKLIERNNKY